MHVYTVNEKKNSISIQNEGNKAHHFPITLDVILKRNRTSDSDCYVNLSLVHQVEQQ